MRQLRKVSRRKVKPGAKEEQFEEQRKPEETLERGLVTSVASPQTLERGLATSVASPQTLERGLATFATQRQLSSGRGVGPEADRVAQLLQFSGSQFAWDRKMFRSLEEALQSGAGILDLLSGHRGFARAAVRHRAPWVLTFDLKHNEPEDFTEEPLQLTLVMAASPVRASFSQAVTPPGVGSSLLETLGAVSFNGTRTSWETFSWLLFCIW
jgi:hypothetical protein